MLYNKSAMCAICMYACFYTCLRMCVRDLCVCVSLILHSDERKPSGGHYAREREGVEALKEKGGGPRQLE